MQIVIRPSGAHPDILTIKDATEQVRDIFDLAEDGDASVAWKLVFATTNTPLTITAEMVSMTPDLSPEVLAAHAHQATSQLDDGFSALAEGRIIGPWSEGTKADTLKRILKRNLNGIGRTDIRIDDEAEPEIVTPARAEIALRALDAIAQSTLPQIDRTRSEIGSIDGVYLDIGHHYWHPAIRVRERKTRAEIWCWISEENLERFSELIRAADVWRHKRIRARGKILFNSAGHILHIEASDVQLLAVNKIGVDEVRDQDFTGGLSVSEYLERFREGSLG